MLLLLVAACTDSNSNAQKNASAQTNASAQDRRAEEINCLRRLLTLSEQMRPTLGRERIGDVFDRVAGLYDRMPLEGCTEAQRSRAGILAFHSRRLAELARRLGDPAALQDVTTRDELIRRDFREFQSEIEGWSNRLRVMREELQRMQAAQR